MHHAVAAWMIVLFGLIGMRVPIQMTLSGLLNA